MTDFDYKQVDDVIHSRIRLAIMALLAGVRRAEFTFLREQVKATDGNLGTHLKKLEDAGYVSAHKHFVERKPVTDYALTRRGRTAFDQYLQRLEGLLPGRGRS
jgi:DNA-binding transcriptional ArsR family regulator